MGLINQDITSRSEGPYTTIRWGIFIFLIAVFFSISYTPSFDEHFSIEVFDKIKDYKTGSLNRQVALLSLGLFGIIGLFKKKLPPLKINGFLVWLIIFYLCWAFLSIAWAVDPALTFKRLVAFAMLCLGAAAVVKHFSVEDMIIFAFFSTASFLLIGLSSEIVRGTFHPFELGYRFAGLHHPNDQGANCAVLTLAAVSLVGSKKRGRYFFLIVGLVAFFFLILTKSRTAFVSTLFALVVHFALQLSTSRKLVLILCGIWISCILLLVGNNPISTASKGVLLGRQDSEFSTLTGRTQLWEELLQHAAQKPFLGYGLGGFWSGSRVHEMSYMLGWDVAIGHSNYIDQLLELGIIGVSVYILIFIVAMRQSVKYFKATNNRQYIFVCSLLALAIFIGLLETFIPYPSLLTFQVFWALAFLAFRFPVNYELET